LVKLIKILFNAIAFENEKRNRRLKNMILIFQQISFEMIGRSIPEKVMEVTSNGYNIEFNSPYFLLQ